MLKSFLLAHKLGILIVIILGIVGTIYGNFRSQLARKDRIIEKQEKTIEQAKVEIFNYLKSDSLAKIEYANTNAELDGLYLMQKKETIKWKIQYFEILNAQQDTIKETGQIRVKIDKTKECARIYGYTLTATEAIPPYSKVGVEIFPVKVLRDYMRLGDRVVEILTPENDCLTFEDDTLEIPSYLPGMICKKERSWFGYGFGGSATILDEEGNFKVKQFGAASGIRFWNLHTVLSSDFKTTRLELMYWK